MSPQELYYNIHGQQKRPREPTEDKVKIFLIKGQNDRIISVKYRYEFGKS